MERSRSRLRSLATPVFAKLILFLIAGLLFTVIHYIGNDTLDLFRLAKLFEIDISNVTYGPRDSAALSTILSGMLLINTLPGLKSNGKQTYDLKFLDFAISALAITLTVSIGWNWLRDATSTSQQSPLTHILPVLSFTLATILFLLFIGVLVIGIYVIFRALRAMLRWFSRQLAKLTPGFHRGNSNLQRHRPISPSVPDLPRANGQRTKQTAETWGQEWLATWKGAWVTHVFAATALAVFAVSEAFGAREQAIQLLGTSPR